MASTAAARRPAPGLMAKLRARVNSRIKPPRRLKFTREGKYFTGMTILIGFGAINTGNNLLYLLLGMMLALIIISGILSETVLQKLEVNRRLPTRIFAGVPALMELSLRNHKRRASSFSIQVIERVVGLPPEQRPATYFMRVASGQEDTAQTRYAFPHRGRWLIEGVEVATRFPFDLFLKSRDFDIPTEVVVYPAPLDPPPLAGIAARPMGDVRRHRVGSGGDFYGMRDYRQGDDARSVHWKTTAKRGVMIVREFEEEEARVVTLCLDNRWPTRADQDEAATRARAEEAVGVCAGLARDLLGRGFAVSLVTCDERISGGTGAAQLDRVLRTLALVEFHGDPAQGTEALARPGFSVGQADHCVVVTASVGGAALGGGATLIEEVRL